MDERYAPHDPPLPTPIAPQYALNIRFEPMVTFVVQPWNGVKRKACDPSDVDQPAPMQKAPTDGEGPCTGWLLRSAQVGTERAAAANVLQAADGLLLDLAHALAGEVELLADLLQGVGLVAL